MGYPLIARWNLGNYAFYGLENILNMFIETSIVDLYKKIDFRKFVAYPLLSENGRTVDMACVKGVRGFPQEWEFRHLLEKLFSGPTSRNVYQIYQNVSPF